MRRIAEAACPQAGETVVEIGPGRGALTAHLLPRAGRLIAIELDAALAAALPPAGNLEILQADVLETDLRQWGPAVVAGNLPYYISSPILERVLGMGALLRRGVFLVQREVAERLAAEPGTRDYGYLSARTQFLARVELLFGVPAEAFAPPPRVDSAVVRLTPRDRGAELGVDDREMFLTFLGQCFRQKRKTLRNNLAAAYGREKADRLPEGGRRAEQMPLEALAQVYRALGALLY